VIATAAPGVGPGAAVVVRDLYKSYGTVKAVDGVTLEIGAGEFVALLGPSGSGKTTILMTIAGFETPDSGEIRAGGHDITSVRPHKRDLGMVFQGYALFPHMTVAENIAFPLRMRGVPKHERGDRVAAALRLVRLEGYGARKTHQLSGGQQQRVALARAVVYDPSVLLMDEPLGALDKKLREEMQLEIKHIQQQLGTTVIYVTHDQAEALTMADRIAVIHEGHLQQFAAPDQVYEQPANAFVAGFVGETNFIVGMIDSDGDGMCVLRVEGSEPLPVGPRGPSTPAIGMAARLAIRPEHIRLAPETASNGLPGQIQETIYGGGTVACVVRVGTAVSITAREAAGDGPVRRPGENVRVTWRPERAKLFAE
jgi:putative spermidine/putrescine transport system ATP-binding protein/mannopine transport system ATP-binding protein